jgi:hypothetical protein
MLPEEVTVQITWRSVDHIPVLDLSGRFVVWTDTDRTSLRTPVARLISEGRVNVLVHLARLTDIDAHGSGSSRGASRYCVARVVEWHSLRRTRWIRGLLALTRLDTIVAIYDSESDAIAAGFAQLITPPTGRYTNAA